MHTPICTYMLTPTYIQMSTHVHTHTHTHTHTYTYTHTVSLSLSNTHTHAIYNITLCNHSIYRNSDAAHEKHAGDSNCQLGYSARQRDSVREEHFHLEIVCAYFGRGGALV